MLAALGIVVTLFLGLAGWRFQLIGKRRTEIAEEALLAFAQALDALKAIRSPATWSHEQEAVRKEAGVAADKKLPGEAYRVTLWRIGENREKFSPLRKLQLLCRYHFGDEAARPFNELEAQVHRVALAASMAASTARDEPENLAALRREMKWEAVIWEGFGRPDSVADKMDAAQRDLEAILTPHLRADAALIPIALWPRRSKAKVVRGNTKTP